MHFGTKFIKEYTSLINESLLFHFWIVTVLPKWQMILLLWVVIWGCPQDTHLCNSRLQGGPKSKSSAPRDTQLPLILYLNVTLKLQIKRAGGGAMHMASTQTLLSHSAFGILPVTPGYSWTQICIWLLRASQSPVSGLLLVLNATYSPNIPIQSEIFLEEPLHKICIQG